MRSRIGANPPIGVASQRDARKARRGPPAGSERNVSRSGAAEHALVELEHVACYDLSRGLLRTSAENG
jgi:hypothetical protein